MSFLKSRKDEKIIAVLDVASASIGGMLIRQHKTGKPEIISSSRVPVNFLLDVDFEAFLRCTHDSLRKVMVNLLKGYPKGPESCLCVFSSPWFVSQTKIINVKRGKPFKITKEFLDKIINDEEKNLKEKYSSSVGEIEGSPVLIDHELMKTEINGYYTKKPLDKTGTTLKTHIYISLGLKQVKEKIEQEVLKNFGDVPLVITTFPLLAFKILSDIINTQEGLVFVDIGGEITDVMLVKDNSIIENASFPRGKNFLLRKIAKEFNTFPKEAPSLLNTFLQKHANEKETQKMSAVINSAKDEWGKLFTATTAEIAKTNPLPQNLFLIGNEAISGQFIDCAKNEIFADMSILGKPLEVKKILSDSLSHYFEISKEQPSSKYNNDVFLMMQSLYANKTL